MFVIVKLLSRKAQGKGSISSSGSSSVQGFLQDCSQHSLAFVVAFLGREGFIIIPPTRNASSKVQSPPVLLPIYQGFLQDSGQHSLAFVVVFLGRQGVIVIPPTKKASSKVKSPPVLLPL